jgi:NAD(P)-dependent dehydrogenase (short-subunit alcohol dehydrogenase family)
VSALRDRVAVVTGAGSGIGQATAGALCRRGAVVHLVDIEADRVRRACDELVGAGHRAAWHRADVTVAPDLERVARAVVEAEGRVDILHNNAGVCCGGPVASIPLADWRWSVDVNLWGVVNGLRAFLPRMLARGRGGHIVNTASMAGLVGLPFVAPYCATKFAVVGLSECLAAELAPAGIRVTVVCPGAVRTRVLQSARLQLPGRYRQRIERLLERRSASPEAVARRIVRAVERGHFLVVVAGDMAPLWWLKRLSAGLYQRLWGSATTVLLRRAGGRSGDVGSAASSGRRPMAESLRAPSPGPAGEGGR